MMFEDTNEKMPHKKARFCRFLKQKPTIFLFLCITNTRNFCWCMMVQRRMLMNEIIVKQENGNQVFCRF